MGVTQLSRVMGTDPNVAVSVLEALAMWEAGRSAGGMDPQRKGWGRFQDRAGDTTSSSSSNTSSGEKTPPPPRPPKHPPPRPPRKDPATSRVATKRRPCPPKGSRVSPRPRPSPRPRARAKPPPPPKPQAPPLQERGKDPYGNVSGVGDTRYVPWREGGNGGTVGQVTVLG